VAYQVVLALEAFLVAYLVAYPYQEVDLSLEAYPCQEVEGLSLEAFPYQEVVDLSLALEEVDIALEELEQKDLFLEVALQKELDHQHL